MTTISCYKIKKS